MLFYLEVDTLCIQVGKESCKSVKVVTFLFESKISISKDKCFNRIILSIIKLAALVV